MENAVWNTVVSKRGQETQFPAALRNINCGYLAYQIETYHKSKNKFYDGSATLKMTGNDCKLLEDNCKKLVEYFLKVIQKHVLWETEYYKPNLYYTN